MESETAFRRIGDPFGRHLSSDFATGGHQGIETGDGMRQIRVGLRTALMRTLAVPGLALLLGVGGAIAQSGDLRAQDQAPKPAQSNANPATAAEAAAKDSQRRADEFAEASKAINGPAGNPECVWLGRRVVVLMWRDDLDTAFRHLDLYDRFGCPGGHVQATFRCLVRFGAIDPKVPDSLNSRVHACWINPNAQPQTANAATQSGASSNSPAATSAPQPAPAGTAAPAAPSK